MDPGAVRRRLAALGRRPHDTLPLERIPTDWRPSAVLILLWPDAGTVRFALIRRAHGLRTQPGMLALPGGVCDDGEDPVATALRETEEELGVTVERGQVLGLLDDIPTPSRFIISPVVAWVDAPIVPRPNPGEVAEVFAVPLDELVDPAIYRSQGQRRFLGIDFTMHEYHWQQHRIWGATAKMVASLVELLRAG